MEGWQSGNAPDSKSGEPANTGAQVQILYLPYIPTVRHDLGRVFLFPYNFSMNQKIVEWGPMKNQRER